MNEDFIKYPIGNIPRGNFCDTCKKYNARHVVCDVIAVKDNKILLIKRNIDPAKGYWSLPAGYVDWDETTEEGAARELKEETGYDASNIKLVGVYSDPKRDEDGRQNVSILYSAEVSGEMNKDEKEVSEINWFDINNLPEKIAFDHRQMITDYLRKMEQL